VLPYDQIPPERRTIGDYTGRLGDEGRNGVLAVALAQWMARDDSKADVGASQAANTAMDEIDAMLRELHQLRARLVGEIRESDDATAARVDAMLADRLAAAQITEARGACPDHRPVLDSEPGWDCAARGSDAQPGGQLQQEDDQ
jgi:hypothetical protein